MTSFTFSLEQLKAAPPEVRRWVEHEIGAALGALSRFDHDASQVHSSALAACTPPDVAWGIWGRLPASFIQLVQTSRLSSSRGGDLRAIINCALILKDRAHLVPRWLSA